MKYDTAEHLSRSGSWTVQTISLLELRSSGPAVFCGVLSLSFRDSCPMMHLCILTECLGDVLPEMRTDNNAFINWCCATLQSTEPVLMKVTVFGRPLCAWAATIC